MKPRILLNQGDQGGGAAGDNQQNAGDGQQKPAAGQQQNQQQQKPSGISLEEHNKSLEKVREDIKKAHFDAMKKLTDERDSLADAVKDLTTKIEALEEVKAKTEKGNEVDIKALIESVTAKAGESARKGMNAELSGLQDQVKALQEENRKLSLREYRAKAIEKVRTAGGELIEPLVRGNSPEEIDQSITEAQQAYAETERLITSKNSSAGQQQQQSQQIPRPPAAGAGQKEVPENLKSVSQLSQAEYRAKREEIMRAAANRVMAR